MSRRETKFGCERRRSSRKEVSECVKREILNRLSAALAVSCCRCTRFLRQAGSNSEVALRWLRSICEDPFARVYQNAANVTLDMLGSGVSAVCPMPDETVARTMKPSLSHTRNPRC